MKRNLAFDVVVQELEVSGEDLAFYVFPVAKLDAFFGIRYQALPFLRRHLRRLLLGFTHIHHFVLDFLELYNVVGIFLILTVECSQLIIQGTFIIVSVHEHERALSLLLSGINSQRALVDKELGCQIDLDGRPRFVWNIDSFVLLGTSPA